VYCISTATTPCSVRYVPRGENCHLSPEAHTPPWTKTTTGLAPFCPFRLGTYTSNLLTKPTSASLPQGVHSRSTNPCHVKILPNSENQKKGGEVQRLTDCAASDHIGRYEQSAQQLLFGRTIGFSPHGEYWRSLRRIAANHLFAPKRIAAHETARMAEARYMLKAITRDVAALGTGHRCIGVPCPVLRLRTIVPPIAHLPKHPQTDRQTLTTSQHRSYSPRASNNQTHPHPKDHTKPAIAGKHLEHCWQKRCSIPPAIAFGAFECISHTLCRLW
jgi:hypothetical protein